jgi:hypothetical protein
MAEAGAVEGSGAPAPDDPGAAPQPQWYQPILEGLRMDDPESAQHFENGIKSGAYKDHLSFAKSGIHAQRKIGTSIVPPGKDAKPEDIKAYLEKAVYAPGYLAKPPAIPESPDKYDLKLDAIPENLRMPELIGEFKAWAHKNSIPPELANELLELNAKQFSAANQMYEGSIAEAQTRITALAQRDGKDMNAVMEGGRRAAQHLLKDSPKTLEKLNTFLGNDPDIMYALSRMGEALGEDTHELGEGGSGGGDDAKAELQEAQKIKFDPAHPQHSAYLTEGINGPLHAKVDAAYKKAFGTKVEA